MLSTADLSTQSLSIIFVCQADITTPLLKPQKLYYIQVWTVAITSFGIEKLGECQLWT